MVGVDLNKKEDETLFQYHSRIIYGKVVDKTLQDYDYSELSPLVYGKTYASDVARRMFYGSRFTLDALNEALLGVLDKEMFGALEQKQYEIQKERVKLCDQRTALNRLIRERSRQEEINDLIKTSVENALSKVHLEQNNHGITIPEYSKKYMGITLNDIHFGATADNYWNQYDPEVAKKRLDKYLERILSIQMENKCHTCYIFCNGDLISGKTHHNIEVTNASHVVDQIIGVSEILANFVHELGQYFQTVVFMSVPGNHSRVGKKDEVLLTERLDNLVEWYLKARLVQDKNIMFSKDKNDMDGKQTAEDFGFEKVDSSIYTVKIGHNYFVGVHGDIDYGKSGLEKLKNVVQLPVYAVVQGHTHHNTFENVGGTKVITSGSFMGMDDYCVSKRLLSEPEQIVFTMDDDGNIIAYYDIQLGILC